MRYTEPITDRTLTDITTRTAKAFFNIADWLRIYNNAQVVKALIDSLFGGSIVFNTVSTPTVYTIPTASQLNTLLANIERIRIAAGLVDFPGVVELKDDWGDGSLSDAPDYIDVNQWEQVLDTIFIAVAYRQDYIIYCGVSAVGQPRFYQNRFRRYAWIEDAVSPVRQARTGVAVSGAGLTRNNYFRRYS